jgi:hypothetical protein
VIKCVSKGRHVTYPPRFLNPARNFRISRGKRHSDVRFVTRFRPLDFTPSEGVPRFESGRRWTVIVRKRSQAPVTVEANVAFKPLATTG